MKSKEKKGGQKYQQRNIPRSKKKRRVREERIRKEMRGIKEGREGRKGPDKREKDQSAG